MRGRLFRRTPKPRPVELPAIVLRITLDDQPVVFADSTSLHYAAKYSGVPVGEGWQTVLSTHDLHPNALHRLKIEIRPVMREWLV